MGRPPIITVLKGRTPVTSNLAGRGAIQSDLGYITTETGSKIATEIGSKILFHIGVFYNAKTIITGREPVISNWT